MKISVTQKDWLLLGVNVVLTFVIVAGFTLASSQGPTGPEGPIGPTGSQGIPGSNGQDGSNGLPGEPGEDGESPYIGDNGNWWIGDTDTNVPATATPNEEALYIDYRELFYDDQLDAAIKEYRDYSDSYIAPSTANYVQNLLTSGYIPIEDAVDFLNVLSTSESGDQFVLTNDIDFNEISWSILPTFSGTLDGAGFALIGLNDLDYVGAETNYSLFESLENATIRNLVIRDFVMNQTVTDDSLGNAGLIAKTIMYSELTNITIENSVKNAGLDVGLFAQFIGSSILFDITLIQNEVTFKQSGGGIAATINDSYVINITIEELALFTVANNAGGIAGTIVTSVLFDIAINNSRIFLLPFSDGFAPIQHLGFVGGYTYNSLLVNVDVTNVAFVEADVLVEPEYEFANIYSIGGVLGYGSQVTLINIYVENDFGLSMFQIISYLMSETVEMEYIAAVAGFLSDYTLMDVKNYTTVGLIADTLGVWNQTYDVAGIVGYSSGLGFYYRVANYGNIYATENVGGILGGVGFGESNGQVIMIEVVNYGQIIALSRVGGLVGSLDGYTALTINQGLNDGLVVGLESIGGIVGTLELIRNVPITIKNVVVRGQVFGIYAVGGVVGNIYTNSGEGLFPHLERILVLAEVRNMFLGFVDSESQSLFDFSQPLFYENLSTGMVIGVRAYPVTASRVAALSPRQEVTLFTLNEALTEFITLPGTLSGHYNAVGFGEGAPMILITDPGIEDLVTTVFLNSEVESPFLWEIDEEGLYMAWTSSASGDALLSAFGQAAFFEPYQKFVLNPFGAPFI